MITARRALATLCVTETVSYGVLYYAFAVLASDIAADTGWSRTSITAAFSGGLLVAAVVGVPAGKLLDQRGPRWIMSYGSILATPAVLVVAGAPNFPVFLLGWLLAGVAMGAVLYPPAFAAVTRWYGERRVRALTVLTLAAGFASTIFGPLTAYLLSHFSWRGVYVVLAALLAVVTIPGHVWGLRGEWPEVKRADAPHAHPRQIVRSRPFVALTLAMTLSSFCGYAVVINIVPLTQDLGLSTTVGAWALGLGGVGQVLGRLGYPLFSQRGTTRTRTMAVVGGVAVTAGVLGFLTSPVLLIAAAIVAGMARGFMTLVNATAVTERWGIGFYGQLSGVVSAAITVTVALAPWAGAALADLVGDYGMAFLIFGAFAAAGVGLAAFSVPSKSP